MNWDLASGFIGLADARDPKWLLRCWFAALASWRATCWRSSRISARQHQCARDHDRRTLRGLHSPGLWI